MWSRPSTQLPEADPSSEQLASLNEQLTDSSAQVALRSSSSTQE
jgi:hypothetical protein